MTLTDFFQGNQEQRHESNTAHCDESMLKTEGFTSLDIVGTINGRPSLYNSSSTSVTRDRLTDLEARIDNIESRLTGIESDAIVNVMARLADINERLGALEGRR